MEVGPGFTVTPGKQADGHSGAIENLSLCFTLLVLVQHRKGEVGRLLHRHSILPGSHIEQRIACGGDNRHFSKGESRALNPTIAPLGRKSPPRNELLVLIPSGPAR